MYIRRVGDIIAQSAVSKFLFLQLSLFADKQVKAEIRITNEEWSSELLDEKSEKYKTLAGEIRTAVCIQCLICYLCTTSCYFIPFVEIMNVHCDLIVI